MLDHKCLQEIVRCPGLFNKGQPYWQQQINQNQQQRDTKVKKNLKDKLHSQGLWIHIFLWAAERQRGLAGCRVNQQVWLCHTVWTLFALQRPYSDVIQSALLQITHREKQLFFCIHFHLFCPISHVCFFICLCPPVFVVYLLLLSHAFAQQFSTVFNLTPNDSCTVQK